MNRLVLSSQSGTKESKVTELILQLVPDMDPMDPRKDCDHVGTMVCCHHNYDLGDEQTSDLQEYVAQLVEEKEEGFLEDLDEWLEAETRDLTGEAYFRRQAELAEERIQEAFEKYYISLPLFLFDHSGLTISTGPFSCPWDSGQVGIIYVSRERAAEEYGAREFPLTRETHEGEREFKSLDELAEYYLKGEVEVYDQYLRGDIWGFRLMEDGEEIDSCWGFYGDDYRTNGILDHIHEDDALRITKVQYMEPTMVSTMQVRDEEDFTP